MVGLLLNIREIVNLDMQLHSPRFILAEFALAAAVGVSVSIFTLLHVQHSIWKWSVVLYFVGYTLNCLAICVIAWRDGFHGSRTEHLTREGLGRKSAKITLLILFPAAVFTLAVIQSQRHA